MKELYCWISTLTEISLTGSECLDWISMRVNSTNVQTFVTIIGRWISDNSHFSYILKGDKKMKELEVPKLFKQTLEIKDIKKTPSLEEKKVERENSTHKKKLFEICESYGEDEVEIACSVFARTHPEAMYKALSEAHQNMRELISGVSTLNSTYQNKMGIN